MKNITERKPINVDSNNPIPLWTFKQEDDAVLSLKLNKTSIPFDVTGQTLKLGITRPNKSIVELIDGFTINKNEVDIVLKNNILAIPGICECDLEISDSTGKMTTASFFINVSQKMTGENNLNASNDISAINKLVEDIKKKGKDIDTVINDVKPKSDKLMSDIKKDYDSLHKIIIDENQAANLQDQVNQTNAHLETKTYYFTTIADMKNKDVRIGDYVFTAGYYEPNDGGESCYIILPNTDIECNDGNLIKLNNGLIAELVPKNGEINVVQFGAKIGNRSEDSSKAIQNAINYVYNSYKEGKSYSIVFSGGVYRIDNQIELNYYTRIKSNGLVKIWCANKGNSSFIFKHVPNLDNGSKYGYQGFQQSYLIDGSVGGFNICGTNRDTNEGQIGLEYGNNNTQKDYALLKNGLIGVEFSNFTVGMQINVYHNYLMHFENLGFRNCHVGVQFGDVNNKTLVNSGENITFDKCTFGGNAIGIRNYCELNTKIFRTSFDMNNCAIQFNNRGKVKLNDCWIERNGLTSFVDYQKGKYGIFVNNNEEEVDLELTDCFMTYGGDSEGQQIKEHLIRGNIQLYVRNLKTDFGVDFYNGSKERLFLCREDVVVRNKNEMNCNVFMLSEFSSNNNNTMFQNQSPGAITIKPNETIIGDYLVNEYLTLKSVECLSDGAITNGGRVLKLCALDNTGGAIKLINKEFQPIERGKKIRPLVIYTKGGTSLNSGVSVNVYLYDALGNKLDYTFNGGYTKEGSSFIYRPTSSCVDVTKISNKAVYYKVEYRVYFNEGGGEVTLKGLYTYEW